MLAWPYLPTPFIGNIILGDFMSWWWVAVPLLVLGIDALFNVYSSESTKANPFVRVGMSLLRGLALVVGLFLLCKPLLENIVLRGFLPWWWGAFPLMVLGVAVVLDVYSRESTKVNPAVRYGMAALRGLAIVGIVFLLCKPVIVNEESGSRPRPVVLLIDNTQSMQQRDPRVTEDDILRNGIGLNIFAPDHGPTLDSGEYSQIPEDKSKPSCAELVGSVFQNPRLALREKLRAKGPLQEYFFGSQLHGTGSNWEKNIPANESRTALYHSINQLLQRDENELPAAIVIATDGIDNDREHRIAWEDIGKECNRLQIPLHIYGVGGGLTRLLQLRSLESNPRELLLADSSVSVTFHWVSKGVAEGMVDLSVKLGGRVVATKRIPVKEGDDLTETLSFVPKKEDISPGKVELEGTIGVVGGRKEEQDKISFAVRVAESKVKVLYVENSPRWEFKYLLRTLQRDKVVEPSIVLISGDDKTAKGGPPFIPAFPKDRKELFAYHMLIIGDVDPSYFTGEQQQWIAEFVEAGGGLVMIAGRKHNPAGYHDNLIGKLLPVEFEPKSFPIDDAKRPLEFSPKLSDIGRLETIMSLGDTPDENLKIWAKLPNWYWFYPITNLKPGAQSLLEHPTETIEDTSPFSKDKKQPMPLIARQYYGRGLVLFVGSDETWRWRFNEGEKFFARFWGQVVYQLGLPHVLTSKSQLIPEGDFLKGKPTKIYARLFTADYRPLETERIEATLEKAQAAAPSENDEKVIFKPVEGQPGLYVATITKDQPGDYNLKMPATSLESSTLPIRVTVPPDDEQSPGNLNEKTLKDLAEMTPGGKYYREENLKDLPGNVQTKIVQLNPPPRKEVLLWTRWWVLCAIIGLLTAEWLIRKFTNLS